MSRSYRKPWVKDPKNSWMKRVYAKAYRRTCRQISHVLKTRWNDDLMYYDDNWGWHSADGTLVHAPLYPLKDFYLCPIYPHRREIINQYSICDFKFFISRGCITHFVEGERRGEYKLVAPYWKDTTDEHRKNCRK